MDDRRRRSCASTVLPASLTWATTWSPGEHLGGADQGADRVDEGQARAARPAPARSGPVCPVTAANSSTGRAVHGAHRRRPRHSHPPAVVKPDFTPMTPSSAEQGRVGGDRPGHGQRDGRHLHHGRRRWGPPCRAPPPSSRSEAVDSEPGSTPLAIGEVRVVHAEASGVGVHLGHEGGDAPGVPAGQQVGVVVGRVHQQAAEHLLLGQLLAERHLGVGVVVDGVVVVVVDVGLGDGDRRARLVEARAGGRAARRRRSSAWSGWPPAPPARAPDATSMPTDGTAIAACPVVGHGSVTAWVGTLDRPRQVRA